MKTGAGICPRWTPCTGRPAGACGRLLMTALSACIGLLPAAISTGIGSQVQRPLATVIVGGMLLGPFMLLLAVPALRMIFLSREHNPASQVQAE